MLEFQNNEFGKTVSFKEYYHLDGVGRKVTCPTINIIGKIIDYSQEITENGVLGGYIVEDSNNTKYFVLEKQCDLVE
jgi:hypothetical protein